MALHLRFPRGLYGITPEWDDTPALLQAITAAAQGGMVALQWRRKSLQGPLREHQAADVAKHCRKLGVVCIINDDWRLAAQVGADGVHMGRDDGSIEQARSHLGPTAIIGSSCYNQLALAEHALQADVDYIAFGAVYPSSVKPHAPRATLELIEQGAELVQQRATNGKRAAVVTIGGIQPGNAEPLIRAGADSIALITALFSAANIHNTAEQCSALFKSA
jgi:thiamine-phosphate pyrophosphorylase